MNVDRISPSESTDRVLKAVERDELRSASKLLLAAASLVFLLLLVSLLPGIDRLVPATPITLVAVVSAIATVVLAGLLLYAAPKLAILARTSLRAPDPVVENVAAVVYWLAILAAVIVAHRGFAGVVAPILDDFVWAYDVAFLLLSLPPVAFVAARLFVSVDPAADLVAERAASDAGVSGTPDSETDAEPKDSGEEWESSRRE